jgi:molecular chaperone GrpE
MSKDRKEDSNEMEGGSQPPQEPTEEPKTADGDPPADQEKLPDGGATGTISLTPKDFEGLKKRAEERDLYRNELLRSKADFENFQKRIRKERPLWEVQALRRFLRDLLPVMDNLERALANGGGKESNLLSLEEGIRLTHQILLQVLADHGVQEILTEGELFNPEFHEAVAETEVADVPTGHILEVLEKGYRHGDTVLRPSKVKVARKVETGNTA